MENKLLPIRALLGDLYLAAGMNRDALREFEESLKVAPNQLARTAKSFGISYFKIPGTSPDSYTIAHSAFITLVGPEGGIAGRFSADVNLDELASKMKKLVG